MFSWWQFSETRLFKNLKKKFNNFHQVHVFDRGVGVWSSSCCYSGNGLLWDWLFIVLTFFAHERFRYQNYALPLAWDCNLLCCSLDELGTDWIFVCPPPAKKIPKFKFYPLMWCCYRWDLWEVIGIRWGHEGGTVLNGISALIGVTGELGPFCSLLYENITRMMACNL